MSPDDIPVIQLDKVFHIGTLDPASRGKNAGGSSLEGHCLSVSLCPHAWRYIARLGGNPLWEMRKPGARFVDLTALHEKGLVPEVIEWAKAEKLVVETKLWKSWTFDDEADEWRYVLCMSEEDALEECDYGKGPDGRPGAEEVTVPVGTWKLGSVTGAKVQGDEDATDFALLAYAMQVPGADGAWWRERFDPDILSAPRGAIFPDKVMAWRREQARWSEVDDEAELEEFERLIAPPVPRP